MSVRCCGNGWWLEQEEEEEENERKEEIKQDRKPKKAKTLHPSNESTDNVHLHEIICGIEKQI